MRLKDSLNTMSLVGYFDCVQDKNELDILYKRLDRLEMNLVYTDKLDKIFRCILQHNSKALSLNLVDIINIL